MYTDNRNAYRQVFFDVWQKHLKKLPLEPLETQVLDIILGHAEYHALLDDPKTYMSQEFALEENPFFHMSLHIALHEQLQLDRPAGIQKIYRGLVMRNQSAHEVEHQMTTVMAVMMYQAQQDGRAPDENEYLKKLRRLQH
jgi:hypothetical protein